MDYSKSVLNGRLAWANAEITLVTALGVDAAQAAGIFILF